MDDFTGAQCCRLCPIPLTQAAAIEKPMPAVNDIISTPQRSRFLTDMQYKVVLVGHDREARDVDGKYGRNFKRAFLNPFPTVLVVLSRVLINTAQKSAAHTARNAVIPRRVLQGNELAAGCRHTTCLRQKSPSEHQRPAAFATSLSGRSAAQRLMASTMYQMQSTNGGCPPSRTCLSSALIS